MKKAFRPIMTRLPETLRKRLEVAAKREFRSMNAEINRRLEQSFDPTFKRAEIISAIREVYESIQKDKRERQIANELVKMQQAADWKREIMEMERHCRDEMEANKSTRVAP